MQNTKVHNVVVVDAASKAVRSKKADLNLDAGDFVPSDGLTTYVNLRAEPSHLIRETDEVGERESRCVGIWRSTRC